MMNLSSKKWPFKWFGIWKEHGPSYEKYPSIEDFVNKEENMTYDKKQLIKYLMSGIVIASTSRSGFLSPFDNGQKFGSISYRTDGKWLWLDDLAEYVDKNYVVIPAEWYRDIVLSNFQIPPVQDSELKTLDFPRL